MFTVPTFDPLVPTRQGDPAKVHTQMSRCASKCILTELFLSFVWYFLLICSIPFPTGVTVAHLRCRGRQVSVGVWCAHCWGGGKGRGRGVAAVFVRGLGRSWLPSRRPRRESLEKRGLITTFNPSMIYRRKSVELPM